MSPIPIRKERKGRTSCSSINSGNGKLRIQKAASTSWNSRHYSTNSAFSIMTTWRPRPVHHQQQHAGVRNPTYIPIKRTCWSPIRVDKLYRNDWYRGQEHPVYTDVSRKQASPSTRMQPGGQHLRPEPGWAGRTFTSPMISFPTTCCTSTTRMATFTNKVGISQHTGFSAMGNDVVDINNDGLPDIVALDMLPENNYRKPC